jgi:hypothetical protein
MTLSDLQIAAVCHEANRRYCMSLGDDSQPTWEDAPEWQINSAVSGVANIRNGNVKTPWGSHQSWLQEKVRDGWEQGVVKDTEMKIHPCLVPFGDLSFEQQMKDHLFFKIATTLLCLGEN